MRRLALATALASMLVASSASAHHRCQTHPHECQGRWAAMMLRFELGLGVMMDGGAVTVGAASPNYFAHARLVDSLGLEVLARPFGGGALIGLALTGEVAEGAILAALGLVLEYDLAYLFDRDPDRDFALALGGSLALHYAHTETRSVTGPIWSYDLMRPDWRAYLELRVRTGRQGHVLFRLSFVTGFDDLLDLASGSLSVGYALDEL